MKFLEYFLVILVSSLGPLIGYFLIRIAPEEQKPGKKYFEAGAKVFLMIVILLGLLGLKQTALILWIVISLVFAIVVYSIILRIDNLYLTYLTAGISVFLSSFNPKILVGCALSVLIYSAIHESIYAKRVIDTLKRMRIQLFYIIVSVAIYFLQFIF